MKRPDISPAPWALSPTNRIFDERGLPIIDRLGFCFAHDARAIAALPDLLAALETAYAFGNLHVLAAAKKALTKAGYTFDDSIT